GGEVMAEPCDVRCDSDVQRLAARVGDKWGDVEILLNVAGVIEVGPFDAMTMDDFQNSLDVNCWGALRMTRALLPGMRKRGWGRIGNVASLGGKRAVPHMLPYAVSKFALVGLSHGLRAELAQEGVLVTTICPSLMRTGSPRNAIFKGQHRKEYAWFCIGDSLPMASMDASLAAQQLLQAVQEGRREVYLRHPMNLGVLAQSYLPGLTDEALALAARVLPAMGGIGRDAARGYQSESAWAPSWLTSLTQAAAERYNQLRPREDLQPPTVS
ncbi:MAG: SDR family oxidoreductase, partial [Planctomycetales bacterium]|nr:SDR family oxidoreductase [Planctomycetales bacterium]